MNDEQSVLTPTPTMNKVPGIGTLAVVGAMALLVGGVSGYTSYPLVNGHSNAELPSTENATTSPLADTLVEESASTTLETTALTQDSATTPTEAPENIQESTPTKPAASSPTQEPKVVEKTAVQPATAKPATPATAETPFCKEYGTFDVPKNDLLEKYIVGPGQTLRDIAVIAMKDETKAVDIITANPKLRIYEIDDILPMRLEVVIPNEKYNKDGITAFIKSRGNISYNATKPMFGVNAPNSGTGPFTISADIKSQLNGIKQGDCVEVLYGSRGYDPQKIVLEVKRQ